jgi:Escherichia/Staphylococcus phage prohead protease
VREKYLLLNEAVTVRYEKQEKRQGGFEIQTLIFPKAHWDSAADCKKWASDHDFKAGGVDETEDSYRIRQRDPGDFVRLRTICINPNDVGADSDACKVKAIGGPVKEGRAAVESQESEPVPVIEGYFARFDRWFHGPFFKERIKKGAFAKSIKDHDIRALWNHNQDFPLGRTRNKTLRLVEDEKGLWGQIDVPDTSVARDALISIKRGDVTGASFGFEVDDDGEEWSENFSERTLTGVKLWEVSPVVFPAYNSTNINARSRLAAVGRPVPDVLAQLVARGRSGALSIEERGLLDEILEHNQAAAEFEEEQPSGDSVNPPRHEAEPEDPALADRKRLADARCLLTFHNLGRLGLARRPDPGLSKFRKG